MRHGVSLDVVLRRYFSGFTLFGDFVFQEAEAELLRHGTSLQRLMQSQSAQLDRLVEAVSEEYEREARLRGSDSRERRRVEQVERLLRGEALDPSGLAYDFEGWHVALVLCGEQREATFLAQLARRLDRRLLQVRAGEEQTTWAWLGGRRRLGADAVLAHARDSIGPQTRLALGEAAQGMAGWRASLRQAKAVMPLAGKGRAPVRYAELGLLACVMKDDVLVHSMHDLYITPLTEDGDGEALLGTLRAYFECARSLTSAAATLGISRQTVAVRLRAVEEKLGRTVDEVPAELEVALRLDAASHRLADDYWARTLNDRLTVDNTMSVSTVAS